MKVLLVNGSPNKLGCTNTALTIIAQSLKDEGVDSEMFWIGTKPIGGCISCAKCKENGKCVFDDVVNEFVEKAKDADGFVFGSPVHYAGIAGNMKAFMDRVFYSASCSKHADYFNFKPVAGIVSARRAGTTATYDDLNKYFGITQMPIISSRYWNMVHGYTPEDVMNDEEGVQIMRILGKNMSYFLKCIEAGKKQGIEQPAREKVKFTNFI